MKRHTFIFDLDDTIIPTHHHYSPAKINFVGKIAEIFGASQKQVEFDSAIIKLYEYIKSRAGNRAPDLNAVFNEEHSIHETNRLDSFVMTALMFGERLGYKMGMTEDDYLNNLYKDLLESTQTDEIVCARNVLNLNSEIDVARVNQFGFQKKRFPGSMVLTYESIFRQLGYQQPFDEKLKQEFYQVGMHPFNEQVVREAGLLPGVAYTLDFLASQGYELHLLTKGDKEVQEMKVRVNGLGSRWFGHNVHIVASSKDDTLERIAKEAKGRTVYKVGNSYGSDIKPAFKAGIKAIYVPCETGDWEKQNDGRDFDIPNDGVLVLKDISQIPENYSRL